MTSHATGSSVFYFSCGCVAEAARRDCALLREANEAERERSHLLDRDKDALQWNVKRLTSERNDVINERIAMEEKILSLETIMADLKTECNTLRVSDVTMSCLSPVRHRLTLWCLQVKDAEQQARVSEHDSEVQRLCKIVSNKDDVIVNFKQLVADNQNAAERLRDECER